MNILYLEEDLFFADGFKRLSMMAGIEVTHVMTTQHVLDHLEEKQPHAIVLDVCLTQGNGFEFMARLKQHSVARSIPVMIWSRLATREDIERGRELGASEYFLKHQHSAREVITYLKQRQQRSNGFTLPEWLVVMAALLSVAFFTFFQFHRSLDIQRDNGQVEAVRAYVSAIVAADQERAILQACQEISPGVKLLSTCKLCKEEKCEHPIAVPWSSPPAYERTVLDSGHVCSPNSFSPCQVTIESDGNRPLSTEAFKLRFFLARDREGWKGGRTHTMNAQGVVE